MTPDSLSPRQALEALYALKRVAASTANDLPRNSTMSRTGARSIDRRSIADALCGDPAGHGP
jgi:hypothetical protein